MKHKAYHCSMSVKLKELLALSSLQDSVIAAGEEGLNKDVSSVSVLESVDASLINKDLCPGDELVLTGFVNCADDPACQLANIKALCEGGEAGLVLFYTGIFVREVDPSILAYCSLHAFPLILMPANRRDLRYSDVITDVMECIIHHEDSILQDISRLPAERQNLHTAIAMLSMRLQAPIALVRNGSQIITLAGEESRWIFRAPLHNAGQEQLSVWIGQGRTSFTNVQMRHAVSLLQMAVDLWGTGYSNVSIHELVVSILQDDPLRMASLSRQLHIDIPSIHEMWIVHKANPDWQKQAEAFFCTNVFSDMIDGDLILFSGDTNDIRLPYPHVYCWQRLVNTVQVRRAYGQYRQYGPDAARIYPHAGTLSARQVVFAMQCRQLMRQGEAASRQCTSILDVLSSVLIETLTVYFLDGSFSTTATGALMHVHPNTIKYRLHQISEILGYPANEDPGSFLLYQAAAVKRLVQNA